MRKMHTYDNLIKLLDKHHAMAKIAVEGVIDKEEVRLYKMHHGTGITSKSCKEMAKSYLLEEIEGYLDSMRLDGAIDLKPDNVFAYHHRVLIGWAVARYIYDNNLDW